MSHYTCKTCFCYLDACTCDEGGAPAAPVVIGAPVKGIDTSIKSDGGSSPYYVFSTPTGTIEMKDVIKYGFDNDFDYGNVLKALRRIHQASKGFGKRGTDIQYDINKVEYFMGEIKSTLSAQGHIR